MNIRAATTADWPEIEQIYREGIRTGEATFNTEADVPPTAEAWFASKLPGLTFVAVDENETVLGWIALTAVSKRRVYAGIAELSVYVAQDAWGQGVGRALLEHEIMASEAAGIWTLQATIFPTNEVSVRLHQRVGFRLVGRRERSAQLNGVWRDTVLLERRSAVVGN
jgi:L-amino acid N-acyltransferase YncA